MAESTSELDKGSDKGSKEELTPEMMRQLIETKGVGGVIQLITGMGYPRQEVDESILFGGEDKPTVDTYIDDEIGWRESLVAKRKASVLSPVEPTMEEEISQRWVSETEQLRAMKNAWIEGGNIAPLRSLLEKEQQRSLGDLIDGLNFHGTTSPTMREHTRTTAVPGIVRDFRDYTRFHKLTSEVNAKHPPSSLGK